jgi:Family with sequence similarity 184, A and B
VEADHAKKINDMKTQVMDLKAGFDTRVQEFKKQLDDFRKNNEAIDALKKAHAKEMADHVQESNRKYNELLTEKLNSEDALKQKAEKELAQNNKEWQIKLNEIVKKARSDEQEAAENRMRIMKEEYEKQ